MITLTKHKLDVCHNNITSYLKRFGKAYSNTNILAFIKFLFPWLLGVFISALVNQANKNLDKGKNVGICLCLTKPLQVTGNVVVTDI